MEPQLNIVVFLRMDNIISTSGKFKRFYNVNVAKKNCLKNFPISLKWNVKNRVLGAAESNLWNRTIG